MFWWAESASTIAAAGHAAAAAMAAGVGANTNPSALRIFMSQRPGSGASASAGLAAATGNAAGAASSLSARPSVASATGGATLASSSSVLYPSWAQGWVATLQSAFGGITYGTTYTAPGTIPHDGVTSSSSAFNSWLRSTVGSGTSGAWKKAVVPSGWTIRLTGTGGIDLSSLSYIELDLTGATVQNATDDTSNLGSSLFYQDSHHIRVVGGTIDGLRTTTGQATAGHQAGNEKRNGVVIRHNCQFLEFSDVVWDNLYGHGALINTDGGGLAEYPTDLWFHGCTIRGGLMNVGLVSGGRVLVEGCDILDAQAIAFDLEPDIDGHVLEDALIIQNNVDTYGCGQTLSSWFLAVNGKGTAQAYIRRVGAYYNTVAAGALGPDNGNYDNLGGLGIRCTDQELEKTDIYIVGNTTEDPDSQTGSSGVMYFSYTTNLTVTGNRQPIAGTATLINGSSNTNVTQSGNSTTYP